MHITKTDYLEYTYCRKNLWLRKYKPELFEGVELSEFEKKIIEEGNEADEAARNLFPGGHLIERVGSSAVGPTVLAMGDGEKTIFQGAFKSGSFFVQADILHWNEELSGWELYEVKATNEVKRKIPHHHVNDLAFQLSVLQGAGISVVKSGVIHLNREYVQKGEVVRYRELFVTEDLTEEVIEAQEGVKKEMKEMETYLEGKEEVGCYCLYRGRNAQCTTFQYSNPQVPEYSVHDINRIGGSKRIFHDWVDQGVFLLEDVQNPQALKGAKKLQYDAYMAGTPIIKHDEIAETLNGLEFPLYFFDYEGYSSAIPRFERFGAYEQIPFQYSLHILHEDGQLDHKEFLIEEPEGDLTRELVLRMREDFGDQGSVISWYKSYECQRNDKLAKLHEDHTVFLQDLNDRMFDLMTVFSGGLYVDAKFKGSASIKRVLPVIAPQLTYKALGIQKGDQAVERWEKMIDIKTSAAEKAEIRSDLLEYCKLDTFAMVEIHRFLKKL